MLTVKLARSKINEVLVLDGNADAGLNLALTLVELAFGTLSQVNSEDLLLSFGVLDDEFKDAVNLSNE
jgi:hypothetical protein